jgi:polysaccharide export outer membrane protein
MSMRRFLAYGPVILIALAVLTGLTQAQARQRRKERKQASGSQTVGQGQKTLAARQDSTYVIGPEDVLDVSVWREANVSRTVPVRPDGKISLPLLNDVQAAGLTPMQLQAVVTEGLKKFISDPQVTVIVAQINSKRVYVLGEVGRPGAFVMLPDMTVLQAISSAGGFSQFAKMRGVYVLRSENGRQVTLPFNYKQVIRGRKPEQNIILKPGDTVVVP